MEGGRKERGGRRKGRREERRLNVNSFLYYHRALGKA